MRRYVIMGLALAALAAGCGGGSDGLGRRPAAHSSQGAAKTASPAVMDGRLGDAVIARPGSTQVTGHVRRIKPADAIRKSAKQGLGAEANCQDADIDPTPANLAHVSDVIFCLMNAMRENNGLPDLRQQDQLASASVEHSQDMVDHKYFAHDSQDGRDVVARLEQAAYIPKDGEWVVGENLAWGSGALATPRALVNAWMNSPPHRENLLSGDFQEVGMGVVFGTPSQDADSGITVTTDFGTRHGGAAAEVAGAGGDTTVGGSTGAVAGTKTSAAKAQKVRSRCKRRHGGARRRCLRAARRARH